MPSVFGPGVDGFLSAFLIPAVLIVGVVVILRVRRNGQVKRMLTWADQHGLGYVEHDESLLRLSRRTPFGVGKEEARDVIRGHNGPLRWQAFELRFHVSQNFTDTRLGVRSGWHTDNVIAIEVTGPQRFFQLASRQLHGPRFGVDDSHPAPGPEFAKKYMMDTDDPGHVAHLMTPEFTAWASELLGSRQGVLRMESGWLMLITVGPHDLDSLSATVDELAAMPGLRHGGTV